MNARTIKLLAGVAIVAAILALAYLLRGQDSAMLMAFRDQWMAWAAARPLYAGFLYFLLYTICAAAALPVALALTLIGGSLFGLWWGTLLTSFASTIGASLAMLGARHLFRDSVRARFGASIRRLDAGIERDGARYLFGLRLLPVLPFVLVNLAMGLTRLRLTTFFWVSQLGMLPATLLYTNAGTELASIDNPGDILSMRIILAFVALAALPFIVGPAFHWWSARARLSRWTRPKQFDFNLIVLGGGAAGLVTAYVATAAKAKVALIEAHDLGGDCLNTGCVPSKALIRSAKLAKEGANAGMYGLHGHLHADFPAVMARIRRVIARIAPHDSEARYRGLGVEVIRGAGRIVDPWRVSVDGRVLSTRRIVIATGAAPFMPPIPGLAAAGALTSETIWQLDTLPGRLLVLGGGAIGCELAQAFARLGAKVSLVEAQDRLIAQEDEDVSAAMHAALAADGVEISLGRKAVEVRSGASGHALVLEGGSALHFDCILVAVGRAPRLTGFGLEELGVIEKHRLILDTHLATPIPTIFAAGDVTGQRQFTHGAALDGWVAAMNALIGFKRWRSTVDAFPRVIYTDPEIARLGLSRREAREKGIAFEETRYDLAELDRAICEDANTGHISVLTPPGSDRILGVTIVGTHAGEMLGEFTLAMRHGLGLGKILATVHPYPGWTEAAKAVAGEWRKAHIPGWALRISGRYFRRLRGGNA